MDPVFIIGTTFDDYCYVRSIEIAKSLLIEKTVIMEEKYKKDGVKIYSETKEDGLSATIYAQSLGILINGYITPICTINIHEIPIHSDVEPTTAPELPPRKPSTIKLHLEPIDPEHLGINVITGPQSFGGNMTFNEQNFDCVGKLTDEPSNNNFTNHVLFERRPDDESNNPECAKTTEIDQSHILAKEREYVTAQTNNIYSILRGVVPPNIPIKNRQNVSSDYISNGRIPSKWY